MSDFDPAFDRTMGHEIGPSNTRYSNDPSDFGGETFCGIARNYHPRWPGWMIVDHEKSISAALKEALSDRWSQLEPLVREFYFAEFWKKVGGSQVPNQSIANELFDTAVNMHPHTAVEYLQTALNALNRGDRARPLFDDLAMDGRIGPKTLAALQVALDADGPDFLLLALNGQQCNHYVHRAVKVRSQRRFARGWLKRVEL